MNTIREKIKAIVRGKDISDETRAQALSELDGLDDELFNDRDHVTIPNGFTWCNTPSGHSFWRGIDNASYLPVKLSGMRKFESGATRDSEEGKFDYEGFLSHAVLVRYAEYMHKHRKQADGEMRASDNWQKGIPIETYVKSKFRHYMETWGLWRTGNISEDIQESLCAELFNTMGLLHEILKQRAD